MVPRRLGRIIRVSSAGQADNLSLPQQDRLTELACQEFGFDHELFDEAVTSSGAIRPILERALVLCEARELAGLCAAEFSRILRPEEVEDSQALQRLRNCAALILIAGRGTDRPTLYDLAIREQFESARNAFFAAGDEKVRIRTRLLSGREDAGKQGKYLGGQLPPFAKWEAIGRRFEIVPDPEGVALAMRVIELFRLHGTAAKVAKVLREDLTQPAPLQYRDVRRLLSNPRLCGLEQVRRVTSKTGQYTPKQAGALVPSERFQPLITIAEWRRFQEQLKSTGSGRRARTNRFPLTGVLMCSGCGRHLNAYQPSHKWSYFCNDRDHTCPHRQFILAEIVHRLVLKAAQELTYCYPDRRKRSDDSLTTQITELEGKLALIDDEQDRLVAALRARLPIEIFEREQADILQRRRAIEEQITALRAKEAEVGRDYVPGMFDNADPDDNADMDQVARNCFEAVTVRKVRRAKYEIVRAVLLGGQVWIDNG